MDYDVVEKLINLIDKSSLREFELQDNNFKVYMSKNSKGVCGKDVEMDVKVKDKLDFEVEEKESIVEAHNRNEGECFIIKSPIVGTFYSSPVENGKPFVKVGDKIEKNQNICIIEAMKLMNEIQSDAAGIVEEIFVTNGEMVEYDQPIMSIRIN